MFGKFGDKHPVMLNCFGVIIVLVAGLFAMYMLIDLFTQHGKEYKVPNVKNITLDNAIRKIKEAGFDYEITDSLYNSEIKPGMVLEQEPRGNTMAKKTNPIRLTISSFSPTMVMLPQLTETSCRDAINRLKNMGFKNVVVDTVPSADQGLVLAVKVNGHQVLSNRKVSITSQVSLEVGDGRINEMPFDVIPDAEKDSLQQKQREKAQAENKTSGNK